MCTIQGMSSILLDINQECEFKSCFWFKYTVGDQRHLMQFGQNNMQ